MSEAISRYEPEAGAPLAIAPVPAYVRARGVIRAQFAQTGGKTGVARLYEAGGLRLRFPHSAPGCEAVIVNTGGGIAGGDRALLSFAAAAGSHVVLTTQSAEKIYRSQSRASADDARIDVAMELGDKARLQWLPQETILFDGASLRRSVTVSMAADASLTLIEATIFGRLAMGETRIMGGFRDRWRITRGGRLAFADDVRIEDDLAGTLDRPACGGGARAVATLLHVAPSAEAEIDAIRAALAAAACEWGASTFNGMLVVRLLAPAPQAVRAGVSCLLKTLLQRNVPRVWQ